MPFRTHFLDWLFYPIVYALNRRSFYGFNKLLYLLALRLLGIGISWQGKNGINLNEERFMASMRGPIGSGIVFDVGANVGHFARAVRKHCPNARIICFEPHPIAYMQLQTCPGIEAHNIALSNYAGKSKLYESTGTDPSTLASLGRSTLDHAGGAAQEYDVEVETIDGFCRRQGINSISFLKIDAEGFDHHVLQGAHELIERRAVDVIEFEIIPACIETKVHVKDFFNILIGYNIYRLALDGSLIPLWPYDHRFCEIYTTQHLVAVRCQEKW